MSRSDSSHFGEAAARSMVQSYQGEAIARQRERVVAALAPQPGEHALDVGCGPGFMTTLLAEAVGGGEVLGFDASETMVNLARERVGSMPAVRIEHGDVTAIAAEDNQFDLAACMQVLLYVADVETALAEIFRTLKPGGRLAIIETDWTTTLVAPGNRDVTRAVFEAWDASVVSPALPARLSALLHQAGFEIPVVDAIPVVDTEYAEGGFARGTLSRCGRLAVEDGFATEDAVRDWQAGIETAARDGEYLFCVNRYLFVGRKPE